MEHPVCCPLCDQDKETAQHLLTSCVFARQFWFKLLSPIGLGQLTPLADEVSFADWWRKCSVKVHKNMRKGLNSAIILGAWGLWRHRNSCVFDKERPSLDRVQQTLLDELACWTLAGANKLHELGLNVALRSAS